MHFALCLCCGLHVHRARWALLKTVMWQVATTGVPSCLNHSIPARHSHPTQYKGETGGASGPIGSLTQYHPLTLNVLFPSPRHGELLGDQWRRNVETDHALERQVCLRMGTG